jgi:hypothetical protein
MDLCKSNKILIIICIIIIGYLISKYFKLNLLYLLIGLFCLVIIIYKIYCKNVNNTETFINDTDDYFKLLKELYPSCKHDGVLLYNKYDNNTITYGELEYDGIQSLIKHLNQNFDNFIDIGSGRGKLPLYVAGLPNISKSLGIEIVTERHNDAIELKNKLNKFKKQTDKVILINKDFFEVDLLDYSSKPTLVWISNLCFPEELTNNIINKLLTVLISGSIISCSRMYTLNSDKIKLIDKLTVNMSWSQNSDIYIYKII